MHSELTSLPPMYTLVTLLPCLGNTSHFPLACLAVLASQLDESLTDMGVDSVDILYLHAPDLSTPIEKTLEGVLHCAVWWRTCVDGRMLVGLIRGALCRWLTNSVPKAVRSRQIPRVGSFQLPCRTFRFSAVFCDVITSGGNGGVGVVTVLDSTACWSDRARCGFVHVWCCSGKWCTFGTSATATVG